MVTVEGLTYHSELVSSFGAEHELNKSDLLQPGKNILS